MASLMFASRAATCMFVFASRVYITGPCFALARGPRGFTTVPVHPNQLQAEKDCCTNSIATVTLNKRDKVLRYKSIHSIKTSIYFRDGQHIPINLVVPRIMRVTVRS